DFSALCSSYNANGVCQDPNGTALYNPFTGDHFPRKQIPRNRITSQEITIRGFLPNLTNASSPGLPFEAPNYTGLVTAPRNFNAYDARFDYHLSNKDSFSFVYTRNVAGPWFQARGTPPSYGNGSD